MSQMSYIEKVIERVDMQECKPWDTPVSNGDKFSLIQFPKGNIEIQKIQKIHYASAMGSLMYTQVCTCLNIAFIVGMLGKYLRNLGMDYWKVAKRVMRYLKRIKDYMLTYRRSYQLEINGYFDSDLLGAKMVKDPFQVIFTCWLVVKCLGVVPNKLSLLCAPWK